jgi:hypothetical protein
VPENPPDPFWNAIPSTVSIPEVLAKNIPIAVELVASALITVLPRKWTAWRLPVI